MSAVTEAMASVRPETLNCTVSTVFVGPRRGGFFGFFGSGSKYSPSHIWRKREVKSGFTVHSPETSIAVFRGTIVPSSPGK